jgi:hypothetical protein
MVFGLGSWLTTGHLGAAGEKAGATGRFLHPRRHRRRTRRSAPSIGRDALEAFENMKF